MAEAPAQLLITDFIKREHFEAEHNVANAILLLLFHSKHTQQNQLLIYFFVCFCFFLVQILTPAINRMES